MRIVDKRSNGIDGALTVIVTTFSFLVVAVAITFCSDNAAAKYSIWIATLLLFVSWFIPLTYYVIVALQEQDDEEYWRLVR
ncbi:hypothetical protein ACFL0F_01695 [Patescibacteria group bacterium]